MLIDEVHISIKAGDGGDGLCHLYHDKMRPKGGPDGGNGGDGGNVYFQAVADITRLNQFRHRIKFIAQKGGNGGSNQKTGHHGQDLILEIPVGTVVSYDNGTSAELTRVGQKYLAAAGGKGGFGNFHFRSSTNQTPTQFTRGQVPATKNIFLELKLIADIGLIGLPNVGKTSLLNELTAASAKVANYPFTTLEPNLGVTRGGFIIADIPGLIEGASLGRGLGVKFLKHIERTKLLIHCLAVDSPNLKKDYLTIRQELANYSSKLASKPELIVLTKTDLLTKPIKNFKHDLTVSIIDDESIKKLQDKITSALSSPSPNLFSGR